MRGLLLRRLSRSRLTGLPLSLSAAAATVPSVSASVRLALSCRPLLTTPAHQTATLSHTPEDTHNAQNKEEDDTHPDRPTSSPSSPPSFYLTQLRQSAHRGDAARAGQLLGSMRHEGYTPTISHFNLYLSSFQLAGDWVGAESAWDRCRLMGLVPNAASYRRLIQVYLHAGVHDASQLSKIPRLYASMQARSAVGEVDSNGRALVFQPTDFARLVKAAQRLRLGEQVSYWKRMMQEQMQSMEGGSAVQGDKRIWADVSYRSLLAQLVELAEQGAGAHAERLLAQWVGAGHQVDLRLFTAALMCYEQHGAFEEAEKAWARMPALGLTPDGAAYRSMFKVYMRALRVYPEQAEKIRIKMEAMGEEMEAHTEAADGEGERSAEATEGEGEAPSVRFSGEDYSHLIKCAYECQLFEDVLAWGVRAHQAHVADGLDDPTQSILDLTPALPLQFELLELARRGESGLAERRLQQAFFATPDLVDIYHFTAWLHSFQRNAGWSGAEAAWSHLPQLGLDPDATAYRTLMQVYMVAGAKEESEEQLEKVERIYASMLQNPHLQLSARDFRQLLLTADRHHLVEEVTKWSRRALEAGVQSQMDEKVLRIMRQALGEEVMGVEEAKQEEQIQQQMQAAAEEEAARNEEPVASPSASVAPETDAVPAEPTPAPAESTRSPLPSPPTSAAAAAEPVAEPAVEALTSAPVSPPSAAPTEIPAADLPLPPTNTSSPASTDSTPAAAAAAVEPVVDSVAEEQSAVQQIEEPEVVTVTTAEVSSPHITEEHLSHTPSADPTTPETEAAPSPLSSPAVPTEEPAAATPESSPSTTSSPSTPVSSEASSISSTPAPPTPSPSASPTEETLSPAPSSAAAPSSAPSVSPLPTAASLSALTVVKLKEQLRELKLPVSGVKAKLIERLLQHYEKQQQ